jgi:5-methylcytosine-specific restriction endonuclease McrA
LKKEEKKAKETFSRYVKVRDCLKTTGSEEYGKCITCGEVKHISEMHCGHFVSGRGNSLFFEETNAHLQCAICNTSKGGNLEIYRMKMIKKYGIGEVHRLESLRHVPVRMRESDWREFKKEFEDKFNSLIG